VGNAHQPGRELARGTILMATNTYDSLHECLLEDIIGFLFILRQSQYVSEKMFLISAQQNIKCLIYTLLVQVHQFMVRHCAEIAHTSK
jgi:hypothetical protein